MVEKSYPYQNGHWVWDDRTNSLAFINALPDDVQHGYQGGMTTLSVFQSDFDVKFKDTVDNVEKVRFRRRFQRKSKIGQMRYITLQDIKDVVLFLASPKDITTSFVQFFHTPTVDTFLRATLVYFQYYTKVWDILMDRREEAKRKIPHLGVVGILPRLSRELSDLRCVVSRTFSCMLTGANELLKFHHMGTMRFRSLTGKERYLFEVLLCLAIRVIWIGLQRKYFNLIELELNRLFRSKLFNIIQHRDARAGITTLDRSKEEDRVLEGKYCIEERKLYQRSPLAQELIIAEHDYRILGIGVKNFKPRDKFIDYLEVAFSAPEHILFDKKIQVGILGMPAKYFDPMLYYMGKSSFDDKREFVIPDYIPIKDEEIMKEFPTEKPIYVETPETKTTRLKQCEIWVNFVKNYHLGKDRENTYSSVTAFSLASFPSLMIQ